MNAPTPPWLDGISGAQAKQLIIDDSPLIRVVAGPGAGKTTCLKRRTQRLVEGEGVAPGEIFVGTFTRAIANDLRAELGDEVKVSTLHSLAYELLRENPAACQGMRLRFLLEYEEAGLLHDVATSIPTAEHHHDRARELRRLQSARSERKDYDDAAFAGAVKGWLQRHGGMLIGEVAYLSVVGLESHDIAPGAFRHVVVDEYQDLTAAEQAMVELVWSGSGSLVVMGDNNQSIYSFRFSHPGGIDEFAERWASNSPLDLTFPENRRCGDAILEVANQMMAEANAAATPMECASGRHGEVALVHWSTVDDEVTGLATYINSKPNESFLVLVTRRFLGYKLQDAIGADARTAFHEEILEHPVTQERFAAASVLADMADLVAIRTWLGFHGTKSEGAAQRNSPAYSSLPSDLGGRDLLTALASGDVKVGGVGRSHVVARAKILLDLEAELAPLGLVETLERLFDPELADQVAGEERRRWLRDDLAELRAASLALAGELEAPSLASVIDGLRYRIATRAPLLPDDDEPRVRIMTLHSAKGLEGDNIVVAGVADELIPGFTADEAKAEQHRLLYVAVTRAKENLVVSWPRAVPYKEAMRNGVRLTGGVRTIGGTRFVRLGRSSLLPQALPGGEPGLQWLKAQLGETNRGS